MRADAVIARLPSEVGLLAVAEARKAARPFAIEVAGCGWDSLWNHGNWQGKVYAPVMTLRMKLAVAESAHSLYVTREFLQRRYPCRQGNTVSCSNVEIPAPDRHVLERRLERMANRTDSPVVLGLIGTLRTRYKGIQTVMEALSRVRAELPPVIFRVLGGGDAGPWKEEAAKFGVDDLVVFDGTRPVGEPVLQWLDEVDLYLQPSFQEGLPRALIEAMSRACPALASTCAGIPELLEGDCLVRPGDAKSLGQLLVESVNNREWQFRQSQRNWSEAAHYSRDVLEKRRFDFLAAFAAEAAAQGRLELSTG
ncbi:MAG: glycosyltransferase [Aquisalimonadaceae bacterium]